MNHITNIRLADIEREHRRRSAGIIAGILLAVALWVAIVAAVMALL